MKAALTALALILNAASAADFAPIENKGIYSSLLQLVNETSAESLIDANAPVSKFQILALSGLAVEVSRQCLEKSGTVFEM